METRVVKAAAWISGDGQWNRLSFKVSCFL
jgi:hypothetical protein